MGRTALLVIDMLNPYRHQDADRLQAGVEPMVGPLAGLLRRARDRDDDRLLTIYVNDNEGDFSATREDIVDRALSGERPDLVKPIEPTDSCIFLAKVRHSAFFGTPLEYLLHQADVDTVLLTGQVTEQCILYTALDAYIRHLNISVVEDAVAAIDPELGSAALRMMERNMRAELISAADCFA